MFRYHQCQFVAAERHGFRHYSRASEAIFVPETMRTAAFDTLIIYVPGTYGKFVLDMMYTLYG
jgi:hypothetical protein